MHTYLHTYIHTYIIATITSLYDIYMEVIHMVSAAGGGVACNGQWLTDAGGHQTGREGRADAGGMGSEDVGVG